MNFLVDNHLPEALARQIETHGHRAVHVRDVGMNRTPDAQIFDYAIANHFIIVTKDEDFPLLSLMHPDKVQIVWLHIGNCRKTALLQSFDKAWPEVIGRLEAGDQLVEVY